MVFRRNKRWYFKKKQEDENKFKKNVELAQAANPIISLDKY